MTANTWDEWNPGTWPEGRSMIRHRQPCDHCGPLVAEWRDAAHGLANAANAQARLADVDNVEIWRLRAEVDGLLRQLGRAAKYGGAA